MTYRILVTTADGREYPTNQVTETGGKLVFNSLGHQLAVPCAEAGLELEQVVDPAKAPPAPAPKSASPKVAPPAPPKAETPTLEAPKVAPPETPKPGKSQTTETTKPAPPKE